MIYQFESHRITPKLVQGHDTFQKKLTNRSAGYIIRADNQSKLNDL